MIDFNPLLADLDDLIGIAIFILFIVIGGIGSLVNKIKEAQQAAKRREQRARAQMQARGQGQAKPALEDEIGAFLRGAQERRGAGGAQPARPAGGPRPAVAQARPAARQIRQPQRPAQPVPAADVSEPAEAVASLRESAQQERLRHLTPSVGKDRVRAEKKVEQHVHDVFDHELGKLEGKPGETAKPVSVQEPSTPQDQITPLPSTAAAGLTALFANTNNLRQAILIHEILSRPEERWNF
jgi:hypothetical protein